MAKDAPSLRNISFGVAVAKTGEFYAYCNGGEGFGNSTFIGDDRDDPRDALRDLGRHLIKFNSSAKRKANTRKES